MRKVPDKSLVRSTPFTCWLDGQLTSWLHAQPAPGEPKRSLRSLARTADISSGHLALLRFGERIPNVRILKNLVRAFGDQASLDDAKDARTKTIQERRAIRVEKRAWVQTWRTVVNNRGVDPETRARAVKQLMNHKRPPPSEARSWLTDLLADSEAPLRLAAIQGIARLDPELRYTPCRAGVVYAFMRIREWDESTVQVAREALLCALARDSASSETERTHEFDKLCHLIDPAGTWIQGAFDGICYDDTGRYEWELKDAARIALRRLNTRANQWYRPAKTGA